MAQLPNVKLQIHPSMFDLMMTVLERNAAAEDVPTRSNARDLMEKRMRFTRLYPDKDGGQYASVLMYESEAAEMIWQLLYACAGAYPLEKEYSKELRHWRQDALDRPCQELAVHKGSGESPGEQSQG